MNLFELFVKIGVDDQASKNISGITSKLGNGLKTAAKIGTAAVSAAAAGITALTGAAVKNYAEYEQLVGGVETLFKGSADKVQEYAANAYKTAGMSANEYMSTVTSFSASLLQSLGGDTEAAAKYADMAVSDMSDNANKMGTDMELIQNAYQGFAKQNYTMLDNLKLGYGGTKTEMERLINDAAKIDKSIDANSLSFGNIVKAINVVQKEMGIYGTTALEAEKTISGSLNAMKGAWSNLITGIADDNADFDTLINNMVESVGAFGENILPRIEVALNGAVKLIEGLFPKIIEALPNLIGTLLPSIVNGALNIVQSFVKALSDNGDLLVKSGIDAIMTLVNGVLNMLPEIIKLGLDLIVYLANGIAESLPELIPTIVDVILQIVDTLTSPDTLSNLIDAAIAIIMGLADGIITALPRLIDKVPDIIENLVQAIADNLPKIIVAGIGLMIKLGEAIFKARFQLASKVPEIIMTLINGFVSYFYKFAQVGKDFILKVKEGFGDKVDSAKTWGKDLIDNFINGIKEKWEKLKQTVSNVAQSVKDFLGFSEPKKGPLSNFHTYAPDMMDLFAKGIRDNENVITDQIEKSFDFGERTIKFGAEYGGGYGVATASGAFGGTSFGTVNINIDGANIQDDATLADMIAERLQRMTERRGAVFA